MIVFKKLNLVKYFDFRVLYRMTCCFNYVQIYKIPSTVFLCCWLYCPRFSMLIDFSPLFLPFFLILFASCALSCTGEHSWSSPAVTTLGRCFLPEGRYRVRRKPATSWRHRPSTGWFRTSPTLHPSCEGQGTTPTWVKFARVCVAVAVQARRESTRRVTV